MDSLRKMLPPKAKVKNYLMMGGTPKLDKRPISAGNLKNMDSTSNVLMPRSGSMDRSLNVSNFNNSSMMGQTSHHSQITFRSNVDEFVMEAKRRISYFSDESSPYSNLSFSATGKKMQSAHVLAVCLQPCSLLCLHPYSLLTALQSSYSLAVYLQPCSLLTALQSAYILSLLPAFFIVNLLSLSAGLHTPLQP